MTITTKYNIGDVLWINNGYSKPVQATVSKISAYKGLNFSKEEYTAWSYSLRIFYTNQCGEEKSEGKDRKESEMFENKIDCVKEILGVSGPIDEALI